MLHTYIKTEIQSHDEAGPRGAFACKKTIFAKICIPGFRVGTLVLATFGPMIFNSVYVNYMVWTSADLYEPKVSFYCNRCRFVDYLLRTGQ